LLRPFHRRERLFMSDFVSGVPRSSWICSCLSYTLGFVNCTVHFRLGIVLQSSACFSGRCSLLHSHWNKCLTCCAISILLETETETWPIIFVGVVQYDIVYRVPSAVCQCEAVWWLCMSAYLGFG
jgi:hypothetical protein